MLPSGVSQHQALAVALSLDATPAPSQSYHQWTGWHFLSQEPKSYPGLGRRPGCWAGSWWARGYSSMGSGSHQAPQTPARSPAKHTPKAATAQTPLGGQGCHKAQGRVTGQSEAQMGGVPHAATVARVPAYTYMHTVIHTCACVPSPTLTPGFVQENLLPGPHRRPYHAGLPPANPQKPHADPKIDTHIRTPICVYRSVMRPQLTHNPDNLSCPSPHTATW